MESQWPENSSLDLKMLINELNLGQEFTNRLRELINKPLGDRGTNALAENLVEKIMGSFCKTLSILKSSKSIDEDSQVNPMVAVSSCWKGGQRSPDEDSTAGSCKKLSPKDQRGHNKKRKISVKSVKETSTLVDDGHVWRKYGQKQIFDSPFPRSYYRCTYKFDQGCQATKQEQRIQANRPRFRTMYQGQHTCTTNYATVSQIILDSQQDHDDSSSLLSFGSNTKYYYNPCLPTFPSTKKDIKEDVFLTCSYPNQHQIQSSSSDHFLPFEYDYSTLTVETSGHVKSVLTSESGNGDFIPSGSVYSSSSSTTSTDGYCMEMDMMFGSIGFQDLPFQFKW